MTRDELTAQTRRTFEAWNSHDAEAVAQFYASGATVCDSADPEHVAKGTDAIADRARMILGGFSDAKLEVVAINIDGNRGCTEWRFTGTHDGDFLGVPATGRMVDNIGMSVEDFDDSGKIVSETAYWDVSRFLRQTGVLPEATA